MPRAASASASSDRSGQRASPSALRRNITRSRHCFSAFDHGSLSSPAATSPSASTRAVSADGCSAIGASDSVIACSVFLRRARNAIAPRSKRNLVRALDLVGEAQLDLGLRDRRRQQDAAAAPRCRSVRRPRYRARAPARRSGRPRRRGRWRARNCHCRGCCATRSGKAKASITPVEGEVSSPGAPLGGRHLRRPALREAARAGGALRAVAAELIEPDIEIDAVAAEAALGQDRRRCRRLPRPRRAGANPRSCAPAAAAAPARAGSCLPSVIRPSASSAPSSRSRLFASFSAGAGGGSRNASVRGIADAPLREVEHQRRQIGGEDFGLGVGARATRSAARPTAGSRRRARCGRRGRGADRPRRARRARFPAASGRYPARSAAPAPRRNRPRCARPRWSARSPRSRSPAPPCDWPFGAGAMARSCTAASSAPNSGTISIEASWMRSPRKFWVRRISAAPGRNASTEPGSARSAIAIASAICRSSGASALRPR